MTSFAYPKGRIDATVRSLVAEAGYQRAVTVQEGFPGSDTDPLLLPRVSVTAEGGIGLFLAKLSPGLDLFERLRGRTRS